MTSLTWRVEGPGGKDMEESIEVQGMSWWKEREKEGDSGRENERKRETMGERMREREKERKRE